MVRPSHFVGRSTFMLLVPVLATLLACLLLHYASVDAQTIAPEQQLADRFAPIAFMRQQEQPCDRRGSAYFPAPVEIVLGNPEVALKRIIEGSRNSSTDEIVKVAPTAPDLAGLGDEFYLDFPGNPRRPGCTYEQDFLRFIHEKGLEPTTYARVFVDHEAGSVVLQYWFWYYFNDWNNTHEGDWERIHLVFDASSVEEALAELPAAVGYAQHGGGELAKWDDEKLTLEGDHPHVFPAVGAQATFFENRLYIGWGENGTGFGCDDTSLPSQRTELDVVLVPDQPEADSSFAWLLFQGRWGERQPWEFNGPRGPNQGDRWNDPLTSMEDWREFSLFVPDSPLLPVSATNLFCDLSEAGARVITGFGGEPRLLLAMAAAVLIGCLFLVVRSRHDFAEAVRLFVNHWRTFLPIGFAAIPIGIAFNLLLGFARQHWPMDWLVQWFNDTTNARLFLAGAIGGLQFAVMMYIVTPPVIEGVRLVRQGESPSAARCFREGFRNSRGLLVALLIVYVVTGALLLTFWAFPVALYLIIRWQFFPQAVVLDGAHSGLEAVKLSADRVKGNWWETLARTTIFNLLAILPGPLIGLILLIGGRTTVQLTNTISGFVLALTVPLAVIGLTIVYERLGFEQMEQADLQTVVPELANDATQA